MKKIKKRSLALIISAIALLISLTGTYALAKYVMDYKADVLYEANSFYFTSDLLTEPATNGTYPSYTLQSGKNDITFVLRNYADGLRTSEVDIDYTVSVEVKSGGGGPVAPQTGTLEKSEKDETITIEDLSAGTYTVVVTATAPYSSVLKADFTVVDIDKTIHVAVADTVGSPVLYLTITTYDYEGDISVTLPTGIYPDNTDPYMKDARMGMPFQITDFKKHSQYTFLLFKNDPSNVYQEANFEVKGTTK